MDQNRNLHKDIGKNIKLLRKHRGLSVEQLAKDTHMAEGTIKNIESGAAASFQVYCEIANSLDVPLDALTPDYVSRSSMSGIYSADMQIFIEAYRSNSEDIRDLLMNVIKSFLSKK